MRKKSVKNTLSERQVPLSVEHIRKNIFLKNMTHRCPVLSDRIRSSKERMAVNMEYEIITLEEKIALGIGARTGNQEPDMGAVIGGLWERFYSEGIYASIPDKINKKALGIYLDYAGENKSDYTVVVACETSQKPQGGDYQVCRIPAGRYARFVIHGDMVKAVGAAWQAIWDMKLPRAFSCDFEEYQDDSMDNAEIHIYVSLKEDPALG